MLRKSRQKIRNRMSEIEIAVPAPFNGQPWLTEMTAVLRSFMGIRQLYGGSIDIHAWK